MDIRRGLPGNADFLWFRRFTLCLSPVPVRTVWRGVDRIVQVTDDEVAAAMRRIFECAHNTSAGALGVAAAVKNKARAARRIAVVISGGNVDRALFSAILR